METKTVTLTSFNTRQANSARGPFTIYELTDTDGITWTAKKNVFDEAIQQLNRPLQIVFEEKPWQTASGSGMNYYFNGIIGGQGAPQAVQAPVVTQTAPAVTGGQPTGSTSSFEVEKNKSIHRQVAAKVSAQISKSPGEFWSNVGDLFVYFQTGMPPGQQVQENSFPNDDIPF